MCQMGLAMKKPKPVISFADYQRLFRVIVTVLNGAEAHTANACVFFTLAGAYILDKVYGVNSRPLCGAAFYRVDDKADFVMAFTDMEAFRNGQVASHDEAFHAWIECDGMVVDFMAPIFRENVLSRQPDSKLCIERKMFQKPKVEMADSPFNLKREGDFFLEVNPALTNELIRNFMSQAQNGDLVEVCKHWYRPTPKAMDSELGMMSNDGIRTIMKLDKTELVGKW